MVSAIKSAWTWKTSSTELCLLLPAHWQQLCQGPKGEQGGCVLVEDSVLPLIAVKALKPLSGGSKKTDPKGVSSELESGAQSCNSSVGNDSSKGLQQTH